MDKNTKSENNHNNWGLKLPNFIGTAFVRKQDAANIRAKTLTDMFVHDEVVAEADNAEAQEEATEADQIEDETAADWLFWRRRRSPPPPPPKPVIKIIKRDTFKIAFSARGIKAINVVPDSWFDHDFVRKVAPSMQKWFGPKGKFSLIPRTIYVAYKPRVEIVVGESQIGGIKEELSKNDGIWDYLIGGVRFKDYKTQPMGDMEGEESDSITIEEIKQEDDEEVASERAEQQEEPVKKNKKRNNSENKKQGLRKALLRDNKQTDEEEEESGDSQQYEDSADKIVDEVAADWFWRRRRRSPPPPPPPPPPVNKLERLFKLVFQSKSRIPQIIGVASDIMP